MVRRIKAKLVLRLREQGLSRNAIAVGYGMSKHSVIDVFDAADRLNVSYDGVEDKTDDEVYALLFPGRGVIESAYEQPDWARVHSELGRVGVTLKLLHAEYADSCRVRGSVHGLRPVLQAVRRLRAASGRHLEGGAQGRAYGRGRLGRGDHADP